MRCDGSASSDRSRGGWAFLNPTYIIGRHVVVHRRVAGSLTPLWVWIGVEIVSLAVTTTVMSLAVNSALRSVGLL